MLRNEHTSIKKKKIMGKITSLMLLELQKGSNVFCNLKNGAVIATKC